MFDCCYPKKLFFLPSVFALKKSFKTMIFPELQKANLQPVKKFRWKYETAGDFSGADRKFWVGKKAPTFSLTQKFSDEFSILDVGQIN